MIKKVLKQAAIDIGPYIVLMGVAGAAVYLTYKGVRGIGKAIDDVDWDDAIGKM